jgi:hypothetical protein
VRFRLSQMDSCFVLIWTVSSLCLKFSCFVYGGILDSLGRPFCKVPMEDLFVRFLVCLLAGLQTDFQLLWR